MFRRLRIVGIAVAALMLFAAQSGLAGAVDNTAADPAASSLAAASSGDAGLTDTKPLFGGDTVIQGESARTESYFEIGKGRQMLDGSSIDLIYGHSETLLPEVSTLTVLVDDVPLSSIALDKTNQKNAHWHIDLSGLGLKAGFHKISFWAKMQISTLLCVDPKNDSDWMVIDAKSRLNLKLSQVYAATDLVWYPSPFLERGDSKPLRSILVVPDRPSPAEFSAAARIVEFLSGQAADSRLNVPIYTEADLTDALLADHNAIWIGSPAHWGERGKQALAAAQGAGGSVAAGQGFIGEAASPWNSQRSLLVVSGSDGELANAAAILSTDTLYGQLRGTVSPLPDKLGTAAAAPAPETGKPQELTLDQLGYGDLVTENVLDGSTTINYTLPGNWSFSQDGVLLRLNVKHSKSIDFGKSVMTVSANGIPAYSAALTEKTADGTVLEIPIDAGWIGNSRTLSIQVSYQFVNGGGSSSASDDGSALDCGASVIGDWAVVDKSSSLKFTPVERTTKYLQDLPYPFVVNGKWTDTTFVAKQWGAKELNAAMTLIGVLGRDGVDVSDLQSAVVGASGAEQPLKDRNLVYVGTGTDLPADLNGFDGSYVKFAGGSVASTTDRAVLLPELQQQATVLQLTASPLNADRSLLLIASASSALTPSFSAAYADSALSGTISSRLTVIDSQLAVHAFPATQDPSVAEPARAPAKAPSERSLLQPGTIAFGLALLFTLALIVATFWLTRRRRD